MCRKEEVLSVCRHLLAPSKKQTARLPACQAHWAAFRTLLKDQLATLRRFDQKNPTHTGVFASLEGDASHELSSAALLVELSSWDVTFAGELQRYWDFYEALSADTAFFEAIACGLYACHGAARALQDQNAVQELAHLIEETEREAEEHKTLTKKIEVLYRSLRHYREEDMGAFLACFAVDKMPSPAGVLSAAGQLRSRCESVLRSMHSL